MVPHFDDRTITPSEQAEPTALVEHFFRHESGRLAAVLTRRFGAQHLETVEDAIQHALERALGTWNRNGMPEEPSAWLTRVASNYVLDQIRRVRVAESNRHAPVETPRTNLEDANEDALVLLFHCADERLAPRTRLLLCLKLLSGFSTDEIAERLFMTPANVQKTLERGRERLKQCWQDSGTASLRSTADEERLATVQRVLYLQFNEGYSFGPDEAPLRTELCDEAIRLTRMLAGHSIGNAPSTWALLSLMHFHASRLPARLSSAGRLIPLDEQNRALWDQEHIAQGFDCLQKATQTAVYSRYHGEAAIQVEHILAPEFAATRWGDIVELYVALERMHPSPVYALNRAIAVMEAEGSSAGLLALDNYPFPGWFVDHHLYHGTRGEMLRRLGRWVEARQHLMLAHQKAPSRAERLILQERITACRDTDRSSG